MLLLFSFHSIFNVFIVVWMLKIEYKNWCMQQYHCYEYAKLVIQINHIAIGECEWFFLLLASAQYDGNLLSGHRQYRQFDSIEFWTKKKDREEEEKPFLSNKWLYVGGYEWKFHIIFFCSGGNIPSWKVIICPNHVRSTWHYFLLHAIKGKRHVTQSTAMCLLSAY